MRNKVFLLEAWDLIDHVANFDFGQGETLSSVCVKRRGSPSCLVSSFIGLFESDRSVLENATQGEIDARMDLSRTDAVDSDGVPLFLPNLVGPTHQSLQISWQFLPGDNTTTAERMFVDERANLAARVPSAIFHFSNDAASSAELEESTGGDIPIFVASLILIGVLSGLVLARIRNLVHSQIMMSVAGLITSLAACGASFGLLSAFQVFISVLY